MCCLLICYLIIWLYSGMLKSRQFQSIHKLMVTAAIYLSSQMALDKDKHRLLSASRTLSEHNKWEVFQLYSRKLFAFAAALSHAPPERHLLRAAACCLSSLSESSYVLADCFCSVSVFTSEFGVTLEEKSSPICSLFAFPLSHSSSMCLSSP